MAKDVSDVIMGALSSAVSDMRESLPTQGGNSRDGLSGTKGIAAGAAAVALAPLAVKGAIKLVRGGSVDKVADAVKAPGRAADNLASGGLGEKLGHTLKAAPAQFVKDAVSSVSPSGGPGGLLMGALKNALPFGDDDEEQASDDILGVGKGRRMPVQQSIEVAVPIEIAYNQWTQYALWPRFMHRVKQVTQEDDTTVSFTIKIWGKKKEFTANIETQRPNERVKWRVADGITHAGLVSFHELGPRLTRIDLLLDVEPDGPLEKAARGMRFVKRAARGDLHRYKAFIEMLEHETGAWRGVIEDGEVVENHPRGYDQDREFGNVDDLRGTAGNSSSPNARSGGSSRSGGRSRGRESAGHSNSGRARSAASRGGSRGSRRSTGGH